MKLLIYSFNNCLRKNVMLLLRFRLRENKEEKGQMNVKNYFIKEHLSTLSISSLSVVKIEAGK